jgi:hypothetical protein
MDQCLSQRSQLSCNILFGDIFLMKLQNEIMVKTSLHFSNQWGKITNINNKTVTVDFNGKIGIYTIDKNEFETR